VTPRALTDRAKLRLYAVGMHRRTTLQLAAALGASLAMNPTLHATGPATPLSLNALPPLRPSPRMPVLFLGHGSPMNAIEDNRWRRSWQAMGQQFGNGPGARYPMPQLILCVSAHWLTRGWQVTGMERPATIHDFGGFPQALFDVNYPAPGWPAVAEGLSQVLSQPSVEVDEHQWGLDHGAWAVLRPMFPAATVPVVQLSMDYSRPPAEHQALGQQLRSLREQGVLIVGSGNIVHNLRAMMRTAPDGQGTDWALEFDAITARHIRQGDTTALANFLNLGALTRAAHPTHDHYLPLLYAAGAVHDGEAPRFFNEGFQMGSISMRSVAWG
jgi:4,5-DOPA dioxygenase extradiol